MRWFGCLDCVFVLKLAAAFEKRVYESDKNVPARFEDAAAILNVKVMPYIQARLSVKGHMVWRRPPMIKGARLRAYVDAELAAHKARAASPNRGGRG